MRPVDPHRPNLSHEVRSYSSNGTSSPVRASARQPARIGEQHQSQKGRDLRIVWKNLVQRPGRRMASDERSVRYSVRPALLVQPSL